MNFKGILSVAVISAMVLSAFAIVTADDSDARIGETDDACYISIITTDKVGDAATKYFTSSAFGEVGTSLFDLNANVFGSLNVTSAKLNSAAMIFSIAIEDNKMTNMSGKSVSATDFNATCTVGPNGGLDKNCMAEIVGDNVLNAMNTYMGEAWKTGGTLTITGSVTSDFLYEDAYEYTNASDLIVAVSDKGNSKLRTESDLKYEFVVQNGDKFIIEYVSSISYVTAEDVKYVYHENGTAQVKNASDVTTDDTYIRDGKTTRSMDGNMHIVADGKKTGCPVRSSEESPITFYDTAVDNQYSDALLDMDETSSTITAMKGASVEDVMTMIPFFTNADEITFSTSESDYKNVYSDIEDALDTTSGSNGNTSGSNNNNTYLIVVGAIIVIAIIGVVAFFYFKKK